MKQEYTDKREEQEFFPYKTYDEILSEKHRQERFRHGMVVVSGIFLMLCAVIVGISMIWSKSANLFELFLQNDGDGGLKVNFMGANAESIFPGAFENILPPPIPEAEDSEDLIYVSDVSRVVKKAQPAVVGIETESIEGSTVSRNSGSGFILSQNGYIITNSHVIYDSDSITVTLDDGSNYLAFVIGDDRKHDIAILKIDANDLICAELGDSDTVKLGEPAVAVGSYHKSPLQTVTAGIISGVSQAPALELLHTDAVINSANTGGPLLNEKGQVIGVNSANVHPDGAEGLGFAIPINTVRSIAEELIRNGYVSTDPQS